jgi:hypothetical protein
MCSKRKVGANRLSFSNQGKNCTVRISNGHEFRRVLMGILSVLSVAILCSTTFSHMVTGEVPSSGKDAASSVKSSTIQTYPSSEWDFAVYDTGNSSLGYSHYAAGKEFVAVFSDYLGNGSRPVVNVVHANHTLGYAPTSKAQGAGAKSQSTVLSNTSSTIRGARVTYPSPFGTGTTLEYQTAWNGIKENVVISDRPASSGNLVLHGTLFYDTANLSLFIDGDNITGSADTNGSIEIRNHAGDSVFTIPAGSVHDSSVIQEAGELTGSKVVSAPRFANTSYHVQRYGDVTLLDVIVPGDFLQDKNTTAPFVIDPSLGPTIAGSQTYNYIQIDQTSDLTILAGGTLILRNVTFIWHGDYSLVIQPMGKLVFDNSTMTSIASVLGYHFISQGTLQILNSAIGGAFTGVQISAPVPANASITTSTISNSSTNCITELAMGTAFTLISSTLTGCIGYGLSVTGDHGAAGSMTLANSIFNNSQIGFNYPAGTANGHSFSGLTFTNNTIAGFYTAGVQVTLTSCAASYNARALAVGASATFTANSCTLTGNAEGVWTNGATATLTSDQITNSSVFDLNATASTVWITSGNWQDWVTKTQNSNMTYRHVVDLTIVDAQGVPIAGYNVLIRDLYGNPAAPLSATNTLGHVQLLISHKRIQPDGSVTFYTPHRIELGFNPTYKVTAAIESDWNKTIYATGDADNDTLPDSTEENGAVWYRPAYHARNDTQVQKAYKDGMMITPDLNGQFLNDSTFAPSAAGTYRIYFRAWSNLSNTSVALLVKDGVGSTIIGPIFFNLNASEAMYASPNFTIQSPTALHPQLTASGWVDRESVLLEDLVVAREQNSNGAYNGSLPGQLTNSLENDTDRDGARDGVERRAGTYWWEAENLVAPGLIRIPDWQASSGAGLVHPSGNATILNVTLPGTFAVGHNYTVWLRAKAFSAGSGQQARITLLDGTGGFSSSLLSLSSTIYWMHGPTITFHNGGSMRVSVEDATDGNLTDQSWDVFADEMVIEDLNTTFDPDARPSNPLQPDTDFDGELDGPEDIEFHTADIVQAENTTFEQDVGHYALGISLQARTAEAHYAIHVRYSGLYRITFVPAFLLADGQASPPIDLLEQLVDVEVTDSGTNLGVPPSLRVFAVFKYSDYPEYQGSLTLMGSVFEARFNLTVGDFAVVLKINSTAYDAYVAQYSNRPYVIELDSWLLQKYRLDPLVTDTDTDGVLDGVEFEKHMQELNPDSDYDHLGDAEEVFPGADGYITNPNLNDTDHDGILDSVEVGGYGDLDNSTRTDPTKADTDGDGIPDGWVDGWAYIQAYQEWRWQPKYADGIRQPWEGEDLNGNGRFDSNGYVFSMDSNNAWASTGGETDPLNPDTDGDTMPDGWELADWYYYASSPHILNPLDASDASGDPDADGLSNVQEYEVATNPYFADIDADGLTDGQEVRIWLRTSVSNGLFNTSGYGSLQSSDWISFDPNPFDTNATHFYNYSASLVNQSAGFGANTNWTRTVASLDDGGLVGYNKSEDRIYVWDYNADPADDWDHNGVLDGTVYVFNRSQSVLGPTDNMPIAGWKNKELISPLNPWVNDSDGDGIKDGFDGPPDGSHAYNRYADDVDGDGLINALDTDSDGDGIPDGVEKPSLSLYQWWSPTRNETDPYWNDTDGDGKVDSLDALPRDQDNDNLTGFLSHTTPYETIAYFGGQEALNSTDPTNPDTDGDGLLDGEEDANHDGLTGAGETSPKDKDTDDDGLWDGASLFNESGRFVVNGGTLLIGQGQNSTSCSLNGSTVACFNASAWYVARVEADFNISLNAGQYWVYANVTDRGDFGTQARRLRIVWDNWSQFEVPETFNSTAPNWTSLPLGLLNANDTGNHTLRFLSTLGAFYLANLTLVPVISGERFFGTDPLRADTDRDGLTDGYELGLRNGTVVFSSGNSLATDHSLFKPDLESYFSNPLSNDTDGDLLPDGYLVWNYGGTQVYGEEYSGTDPSSNDTDGDHLTDFQEVVQIGSSPTKEDTDGDGLLDSYEPLPKENFDNDLYNNIHDYDSNAQPSTQSDYNSTVTIGGVNQTIKVVLRTNVSQFGYGVPRTWLVLDTNNSGNLTALTFNRTVAQLPGGTSHVYFDVSTGVANWTPIEITTFEGYAVFLGGGQAYVALPNGSFAEYRPWNDSSDGARPPMGNATTHYNALDSNYRYREVLNWSAVLDGDADHDGLNNSIDSQLSYNGQNCGTIPDCDGDGLPDGYEYYFVDPAAVTNPDFDGDGLGDGYEVYGTHTDPAKPDTDLDGLWDGNFSKFDGGTLTIYQGELSLGTLATCLPLEADAPVAAPKCWDFDGDGMPDGWEVRYSLDPKDPTDNVSDVDNDGLTAYEEYNAYRSSDWNETLNGAFWGGTNPTTQDTDSDGMPDSFEVHWGLNARVNDANQDPDQDHLTNLEEYTNSKTDANWTDAVNGSWPWWLTTDPFNADTDNDGYTDYQEGAWFAGSNDVDGDGIPNALDNDSDGDGLSDATEIGGWTVYVVDHAPAAEFLQRLSIDLSANFDPSKIRSFRVTSNPYNVDTDGDGVPDFNEWQNGSDPSSGDTDGDGYDDAHDTMLNETSGLYESAATMQEFDPPTIDVNGVWWEACDAHVYYGFDGCLHIDFTVEDKGSGLENVTVSYLGQWQGSMYENALGWHLKGWGDDVKFLHTWMIAPASMYSERDGTYKFAFEACDKLNNCNSTIFAGGREFTTARDWAKSMAQQYPAAVAGPLGYIVGARYGFMGGWQDMVQGLDDLVHGRVDLGSIVKGLGNLFNPSSWGQMYDASRLDYMKTLSLSVDPYVATTEDQSNLGTNGGIYWMLDHGADLSNASHWLQFAKRFWDGLCAGRAAQEIISIVASFGWGALLKLTTTGARLAMAFAEIGRIIGTALRHVLTVAVTKAQTILRPLYEAIVVGLRSAGHALRDFLSGAAERAIDALDGLRNAVGGFGRSIKLSAYIDKNAATAAEEGIHVEELLSADGAETAKFLSFEMSLSYYDVSDMRDFAIRFEELAKRFAEGTDKARAGEISHMMVARFEALIADEERAGRLMEFLSTKDGREVANLLRDSAIPNPNNARGAIHEDLFRKTAESQLGGLGDVVLTRTASGDLLKAMEGKGKVDWGAIVRQSDGTFKFPGIVYMKSDTLEWFKTKLSKYASEMESWAENYPESAPSSGGKRIFATTQENVDWLNAAAHGDYGLKTQGRVLRFLDRIKSAGFGDPIAVDGFEDAMPLLRPPGMDP